MAVRSDLVGRVRSRVDDGRGGRLPRSPAGVVEGQGVVATVTATLKATPAAVHAVLADGWAYAGWAYAGWVVGASHVRAVQGDWPAVRSRLFHASGTWPLLMEDHTQVEQLDPGRRLVLLAHGGRLGDARIELSLTPDGPTGGHTRVTMVETPVAGPGKWVHNPIADAVLTRRNTEALTRLGCLVEHPTTPTK